MNTNNQINPNFSTPPAQPIININVDQPIKKQSFFSRFLINIIKVPFKIINLTGNIGSILFILFALFIFFTGIGVRAKLLSILDSVDQELYNIENTKVIATVEVSKGVTIGTKLPISEVIQNLNAIPDSIPINTNVPLNTSFNINTDLPINSSIPINTESLVNISIPIYGLQPIKIPINLNAPLNTSVPLKSIVPINSEVPLAFDIPINQDFKLAMQNDLDLETTIPVYTEIPLEVDLKKSNLGERFAAWHKIINDVRNLLLANDKNVNDFIQKVNIENIDSDKTKVDL